MPATIGKLEVRRMITDDELQELHDRLVREVEAGDLSPEAAINELRTELLGSHVYRFGGGEWRSFSIPTISA